MLFWVATACKQARVLAGRIQSQVAASAVVDQATINRFEHHIAWPKVGADRIVAAYADDLDVDVLQLWQQAIQLWQRRKAGESLEDLGIETPKPNTRRRRRNLKAVESSAVDKALTAEDSLRAKGRR